MSVKAMSLVWDLKCPQEINSLEFRSNHKYVLISYADHADHHGRNIWPAIKTIAEKTGLDDRTVQRMTHDLESMGLLVEDGQGPRGTNRWCLPFNDKGDSLTPVTVSPIGRGDKNKKSLGDKPSGDKPSGDKVTPELNEPEPDHNYISIHNIEGVWDDTKAKLKHNMKRADYETWVSLSEAIAMEDKTMIVMVSNSRARNWLEENAKTDIEYYLGYYIKFITAAEHELAEAQP